MIKKRLMGVYDRTYFEEVFKLAGALGETVCRKYRLPRKFLYYAENDLPHTCDLEYGGGVNRDKSVRDLASHIAHSFNRLDGVFLLRDPCMRPRYLSVTSRNRVLTHNEDVYYYCLPGDSLENIGRIIKIAETGFPFVCIFASSFLDNAARETGSMSDAELERLIGSAMYVVVGILDFESYALLPLVRCRKEGAVSEVTRGQVFKQPRC